MEEHVIKRIAEEASEKAVKEVLTQLGIDPSNPLSSQQDFVALREVRALVGSPDFQADLMHLRKWRLSVESVQSKGLITMVGILVSGAAAALWMGIKAMVGAGH